MTRKTPTQACYWIVGSKTERPFVAVDLHDETGELVRPHGFDEPKTIEIVSTAYAKEAAVMYAAEHGIGAAHVHFDEDSTEFFAND